MAETKPLVMLLVLAFIMGSSSTVVGPLLFREWAKADGIRLYTLMAEQKRVWSLEHIPGYDDVDPSATVDVLAADIDTKLASVLIRKLNVVAPLTSLEHVKRIRKVQGTEGGAKLSIILCLEDGYSEEKPGEAICVEVKELVDEHSLRVFSAKVPKHPASNREEWTQQCQLWPTTFHPNAARPTKLVFDDEETATISMFMEKALEQAVIGANKYGRIANGAVIVDPSTRQVISCGYDQSTPPSCSEESWHPLRHAVMVAIDEAAKRDRLLFPDHSNDQEGPESSPAKRQRTGAEACVEIARPYLCTGFDIYVVKEPCAMCAMAMVHQRFRRVIYAKRNATNGALGGKFCVHKQQSLNHHYLVISATNNHALNSSS